MFDFKQTDKQTILKLFYFAENNKKQHLFYYTQNGFQTVSPFYWILFFCLNENKFEKYFFILFFDYFKYLYYQKDNEKNVYMISYFSYLNSESLKTKENSMI